MLRLYVKKLLSLLACAGVLWLIFFLGSGALLTTANFFSNPVAQFAVLAGIPAGLTMLIIFLRRLQNMKLEGAYLAYCDGEMPTVKKELTYLWRFDHLRAELAAAETVVVVLVLALSASGTAPWYANLLVSIFCLVGVGAVFLLLDGGLWLLIHARWRRSAVKRGKKGAL